MEERRLSCEGEPEKLVLPLKWNAQSGGGDQNKLILKFVDDVAELGLVRWRASCEGGTRKARHLAFLPVFEHVPEYVEVTKLICLVSYPVEEMVADLGLDFLDGL